MKNRHNQPRIDHDVNLQTRLYPGAATSRCPIQTLVGFEKNPGCIDIAVDENCLTKGIGAGC